MEKGRRKRDERLRYFEPNPAQRRFIDEISKPGAFVVVNGGGNGSGKTYSLIAILAAIMWPGIAPKAVFGAPIFQDFPHPKRIWLVSNPAELGDTSAIQAAIDDLWPKGKYTSERKGRHYKSVFKSDTGFTVELKSTEMDEREFRGATVGVIGVNEPLPEKVWNELVARTRKGGLIIGAMTSLYDEPWLVDGIFGKANGNDFRVIYGGVEDNCKDHTPGGTLSHEQIERILSQYDPDEQEARRSGKPLSLSGRIYKGFDRAVHVAESEIVPPAEGVTHYQAVDPAIGKPVASLWGYVDATGYLSIYREWPTFDFEGAKDSNLSVKEYADLFKSLENGTKIETRILDRHFGNARRTLGGSTLRQEFMAVGINFIDSYTVGENLPEVETGILKVKGYLKYDKAKPIDALNRPSVIISPTCKNLIAAFERWGRNPQTGKPKEEYKDFSDVARYLMAASPVHEVMKVWPKMDAGSYGVNTGHLEQGGWAVREVEGA